jgi:hypothetical protein
MEQFSTLNNFQNTKIYAILNIRNQFPFNLMPFLYFLIILFDLILFIKIETESI